MYWLPYFAANTCFQGSGIGPVLASNLSNFFYFGGVVGGIGAGAVSDISRSGSLVSFTLCILSSPMLYIYHTAGELNPQAS